LGKSLEFKSFVFTVVEPELERRNQHIGVLPFTSFQIDVVSYIFFPNFLPLFMLRAEPILKIFDVAPILWACFCVWKHNINLFLPQLGRNRLLPRLKLANGAKRFIFGVSLCDQNIFFRFYFLRLT
jgi:hypothetical protein